jgi:TPR repeat protein
MSIPARLYNQSLDYLRGKSVPKDEAKAYALNAEAAEFGDHDAVLAMGWFFLNGIGVEQDSDKAEHWYRKSARHGETKAMFSLGQMAHSRNAFEDALLWSTRAADKGHKRSLYWLGKLYWRGQGVAASDKKRGMGLFQSAAKEHVVEAQRLLRYLSRRR